jgi:hypothetical protein
MTEKERQLIIGQPEDLSGYELLMRAVVVDAKFIEPLHDRVAAPTSRRERGS